jgi:hypothetical protein
LEFYKHKRNKENKVISDDSLAALCETLTSLAVKKIYQASGEAG